jgi:predicted glycoside hydrolase/deacetylase ChbG (UPF0249 family)
MAQYQTGSGAMPCRIIVNADDFGLHPATNLAIEAAHRSGIVKSASLMMLGAACDDAVRRARILPALDLGLHFCLVGAAGMPRGLSGFAAAFLGGEFPAARIESEMRRQLDLALHEHRAAISHIDSHQHLHALPAIMRVVCRVAAEYDIPGIRLPLDGPALTAIAPPRRAQAAALRAMCRLSRRYIDAYERRTTDHFAGMAVSGHLTARTLARCCAEAGHGTTEIVCHPGGDNAALSSLFDWGFDWETEMAAVCAPMPRKTRGGSTVSFASWRE